MLVDAALRRMAGRLSVLQLDPHHADGMTPAALRAWRIWIGGTLRALAAGERVAGRRPEGRVPDAVARIAQQIEMLRAAPLMGDPVDGVAPQAAAGVAPVTVGPPPPSSAKAGG